MTDTNAGTVQELRMGKPDNAWEDALTRELDELRERLTDPESVDVALAGVEAMLRAKHERYGQDNLKLFGEYGILVRASDKVARLKNMIEKRMDDCEESRADSWRDLAGYAIQALILMALKDTDILDIFKKRQSRLRDGLCPDCGSGEVLMANVSWGEVVRFYCSRRCGFEFYYGPLARKLDEQNPGTLVDAIAAMAAKKEQL